MIDLPYSIAEAIARAITWLSFDELPEDERPEKRIWQDGPKLREWFAAVKKRREEKYGTDGKQPIEDPVQNAAAKDLIVG